MEFDDEIFEIIDEDIEDIEDVDDDTKLAEIYKLAVKLIKLLDSIKSQELREGAFLLLIKEILNDDPLLMGLTSKMIQDLAFGISENENYVS
ncbi:hypothetical protein Asulf_00491 [Archaeoglobus sulfaticallidus PM70-1]|uniref:Uncharacterized protein n=1 Tax=Archaeoglobus sulfaticallidus PM70-1 TaxID=387631 RepID=N0BAA4_9EURY|nr:hypothetical protein [Archaeoglobus sulfaticallidus]AGK60514.1 hypothetical protein Asulf_00491 [Archaeoglobus sulfaticallidus PM70-1]